MRSANVRRSWTRPAHPPSGRRPHDRGSPPAPPELSQSRTDTEGEATPAQQAMAVAVAFALAAESNVTQVLEAWLAGRFDRVSACYTGAQKILQGHRRSRCSPGEHFAGIEWNVATQRQDHQQHPNTSN